MRKIFKYSLVIFTAALILLCAGICRCDDSSQNLKTFRGQVVEVDWVGSLITCQGEDEITFYVPPGIKIRHGTDTVSLEDIDQGDDLLIRYVDNPAGTPRVVSMTLDKSYPEM